MVDSNSNNSYSNVNGAILVQFDKSALQMATPLASRSRIAVLQRQLEERVISSSDCRKRYDEISPTLNKLRNTPVTSVAERRKTLIVKQTDALMKQRNLNEFYSNSKEISSDWPKIDLLQRHCDVIWLVGQSIFLCLLAFVFLMHIHGDSLSDLQSFTSEIQSFCNNHVIKIESELDEMPSIVTTWHETLLQKTESLQYRFDIAAGSTSYFIYVIFYVLCLTALFCLLVKTLRSENRLTLPCIKIWSALLSVIFTWLSMVSAGLIRAYQMELQVINCVHQYSLSVAKVGITATDLAAHQTVLMHWKSRFLETNSKGLLHILGPLTVKDLIYYLVYYSVPLATVLLGPLVRLFISCWQKHKRRE